MKGISIDELLDERVRPQPRHPDPQSPSVSRFALPVPGRQRAGYPAVLRRVGEPGHPDARAGLAVRAACAGHEILRPAGTLQPAHSSSWRSAIRAPPRCGAARERPVAIADASVASRWRRDRWRAAPPLAVVSDPVAGPRGVVRFASMRGIGIGACAALDWLQALTVRMLRCASPARWRGAGCPAVRSGSHRRAANSGAR